MVEVKLYIKEIKRIIPGDIIDFDKTMEYLIKNILFDCNIVDSCKTFITIEVPNKNLIKQEFNSKTFYTTNKKKYAVFTEPEGELFILFQ